MTRKALTTENRKTSTPTHFYLLLLLLLFLLSIYQAHMTKSPTQLRLLLQIIYQRVNSMSGSRRFRFAPSEYTRA
ncbi:hypothetical protein VIGAN_04326400 [Vigna angularis var. angularis]|uniref:Uncharacterized protein n=1 Tax=Vigna angularis var. angularis TaxID=157739 RepID=A0A0S3RYN4_PHAAN|nr:hypothetical protein VIGAN_04326400 [Vigna angularis var. angularis]